MAIPYGRSVGRGAIAVLVGVGTLTACGDKVRETRDYAAPPTSARPAEPTGTTLVLRWRTTGGFAGLGGPGSLPDFSLYADGRALVVEKGALKEYRLARPELRRLLDEARAIGLDQSRTAGDMNIADATVLEFTMGRARTRVVQPDALDDPAVRFRKRLDPSTWPGAEARPYVPERLAVLTGEAPAAEARAWPLPPLGKGEQAAGGVCQVFTGDTAREADRLAGRADPDDRWRSGGKTYSVRFRPLLPEERTCGDVART